MEGLFNSWSERIATSIIHFDIVSKCPVATGLVEIAPPAHLKSCFAKPVQVQRDRRGEGGLWAKMFGYSMLHRDEFMTRYHQRSNVESTFSMIKRKFGDSVRSKGELAMRNEVLAKLVCHNL